MSVSIVYVSLSLSLSVYVDNVVEGVSDDGMSVSVILRVDV